MKGLYLCARQHRILGYDIVYNDILNYEGINEVRDCRELLNIQYLTQFDYIIATPPCNFYSRANWRRDISQVAQDTKDLLPLCLIRLSECNRPFIVENVCNDTLILNNILFQNIIKKYSIYWFKFNNHIFFSNMFMFQIDKSFAFRQNKQYVSRSKRDNNPGVDLVLRTFVELVNS